MDGGGDGGTVASQAAPITALPPYIPESPTQDQFEPHRGQDESESSTLVGAVPLLSDWGALVGPMDLSGGKTMQPSKTWSPTSDQFEPRRGKNKSESGTVVMAMPLLGDLGAHHGPMDPSDGEAMQASTTWTPTSDQFEPRRGQNIIELGSRVEAVPLLSEGFPAVVAVPSLTEGKAERPLVSWLPPVEVADRVRQLLDNVHAFSDARGHDGSTAVAPREGAGSVGGCAAGAPGIGES